MMEEDRASRNGGETCAATPKSAATDPFLDQHRHAGTPGCTNPECGDYPYYGVAPHECFYKRGAEFSIGQSVGLPPSEWPANFVPDLEPGETPETVKYPNACGTYYCPACFGGSGSFSAPQGDSGLNP